MKGVGKGKWVRPVLGKRLVILNCFDDLGPMTSDQARSETGFPGNLVRQRISDLRKSGHLYIERWVSDNSGEGRRMPRAVYAIGNLPDAKKPKPKSANKIACDWRAVKVGRVRSISIFHSGMSVRACLRYKLKVSNDTVANC